MRCDTPNFGWYGIYFPLNLATVYMLSVQVSEYLTLASGPVLSKWALGSGSSLEDFRVSEYEETLLKRTL